MKNKTKRAELKREAVSGCYFFRTFKKHRAIAAFSTRRFKINFNSGGKDSVTIAHRRLFCQFMGLPFERVVGLEQVHGANIVRIGQTEAGKGSRSSLTALKGSDAAITDKPGLVLTIRTADCAPLFFLDPKRRAIGIAHVGWRGASERLASKMVQAIRRQFLSRPEDLIVGIGPMIRPCCYQVGPEFQGVFGAFIEKRESGLYFDLIGWIYDELSSEGISRAQIYDSFFCTSCSNDLFPSYRKEGNKVRHMWSVLALRK